jgi:hypothetical protein
MARQATRKQSATRKQAAPPMRSASNTAPPTSAELVPMYVVVYLHPVSKKQFDDANRSKNVLVRKSPACFLVKGDNDSHTLFVSEGGQCFEGTMMPPYTPDMLNDRESSGVMYKIAFKVPQNDNDKR